MGRFPRLGLLLLVPGLAAACSSKDEESGETSYDLITSVECSITKGSFIQQRSATASGEIAVTCPPVTGVLFNNQPIAGEGLTTFNVKPTLGINVLHVARTDGTSSEIPFLFGNFADANTLVSNGLAARVNKAGISDNGQLVLPIPAGSVVNLSQIGTQIVRDQGNVLGKLDGAGIDVSGIGFKAGVRIVHSEYDPGSVRVTVTPRNGGVHVDASIGKISSTVEWDAGVLVLGVGDQLSASADGAQVSADIDLRFDNRTKKLVASLGPNHDVHVDGVALDSAALDKIPFIAIGVEGAISAGAEALVNGLADPLLDVVRSQLAPALAVGLESLKLPKQIEVPMIGGKLNIAQNIAAASFDANGAFLSLDARVSAPTPNNITAPGFLSQPSKAPTFDTTTPLAVSLTTDFVNEALFAGWKQGLLNRPIPAEALVALQAQFPVPFSDVTTEALMPPVVFAHPNGRGLAIHAGELILTTTYTSPTFGAARVKIAVSLQAGADVALGPGGESLVVKPNHDAANTHLYTALRAVESGKQEAGDELAGILSTFGPVIEAMLSDDLPFPPVAIPQIDLGLVTPGFAGQKALFDGSLRFDPAANRIGLSGKLVRK